MFKKLFKGFIFFALFNFIMGLGFVGWFGYNLVAPSLEGTDVSFFDLVTNNVDEESAELLEKKFSENASTLGDKAGKKIVSFLEVLMPDPDFSYADMPPMEYPFPSVDEVIKANEEKAKEGFQQGLEIMKQNEVELQKSREEGLRILQESEKTNDAIKEQTLNDDNN